MGHFVIAIIINQNKMIVIATYNGGAVLKDLLGDIKYYDIPNNEVCVVDNNSTYPEHLRLLINLVKEGYNVLLNSNDSYEVGAFKLAVDTFKSDIWFCLQDSIRIKQNIFETVTPLLTNTNAYTFLTFNEKGILENHGVRDFLKNNFQLEDYRLGLFGNMFFAKNEVVQLVKNDWIIPKDKWGVYVYGAWAWSNI